MRHLAGRRGCGRASRKAARHKCGGSRYSTTCGRQRAFAHPLVSALDCLRVSASLRLKGLAQQPSATFLCPALTCVISGPLLLLLFFGWDLGPSLGVCLAAMFLLFRLRRGTGQSLYTKLVALRLEHLVGTIGNREPRPHTAELVISVVVALLINEPRRLLDCVADSVHIFFLQVEEFEGLLLHLRLPVLVPIAHDIGKAFEEHKHAMGEPHLLCCVNIIETQGTKVVDFGLHLSGSCLSSGFLKNRTSASLLQPRLRIFGRGNLGILECRDLHIGLLSQVNVLVPSSQCRAMRTLAELHNDLPDALARRRRHVGAPWSDIWGAQIRPTQVSMKLCGSRCD
mmetsp:Transcript_68623/g.146929  ORF Transcript_68623/g.146929 Transcript_68623/m.146929 type:complete len:341 (+) Transcript_68623:680-1702(+)